MKEKLIECFQDTLDLCGREVLAPRTGAAISGSRVIREGFTSSRLYPVREMEIQVVEGTSFAAARENLSFGRVAVLNFANPHYPGGGVDAGAMAQEECLCRSSNLFPCLCAEAVFGDYYRYHRTQTDYNFSDRLILSPRVTVFKDDAPLPQHLPQKDWFQVDVITCSAPYLSKRKHINLEVLGELFCKRIRNILEGAIELEAEVLILGAFGCGAFGNPPEVVARAFQLVLQERRYRTAFSRVVFAIKSSVEGDPYTVCRNLAAFQLELLGTSRELEKLRYVGGAQPDPSQRDIRMPGGRIRYRGSESRNYHQWKLQNPYFTKQFSILGDANSTLEGFHPQGNPVFYSSKIAGPTGVQTMADTWWGKVIGFFGGQLLVNDSRCGAQVARPEDQKEQFPCACSDQRTGRLHTGSVQPDVILVNVGINDWLEGVALQPEGTVKLENADTCFSLAYGLMLSKLKKNYPQAEIWCMTLCRTCNPANPALRFPDAFGGIHIREYNRQIVNAALANGCRVADVAAAQLPLESLDGTHPTRNGMDTLAMLLVRQMADAPGSGMLDCPLTHEPSGTVCRRCGKVLPRQEDREPLQLQLTASGRTLVTNRWQATLGRSAQCDFVVENPYITRIQATFTCREGQWFLRDQDSRNGTYLNSIRLESGKEYPLHSGDRISFAKKEEALVL